MLIGIDASRAVSPHPTGTEVYSQRLIQNLLALGSSHRFRLYLRVSPPPDLFHGAELRVLRLPRLWTHLRLSLEMAVRPPDLLFVPAHVLPPVRPPLTLVTVHDLGYLRFPHAHPPLQRIYLDLSTRWNVQVATHVLADSEATRADLIARYGTPAEQITVVYPGYDEGLSPVRDPTAIEAAKGRYGIEGEYFLHLGTLQPRKNLSCLIAAFADLLSALERPYPTLVLAGRPGWMYKELFRQVHRLGIADSVRFIGYVPDEDKAALLSGAVALVFPSLYEGFGLPVLEAQACGCPVICSRASSLPEVAGEGAVLVDPHHTLGWTEAMARLWTEPTLRSELAERGFANLRRFSWRRCAETVMGVIDRLAG